MRPVGWQQEVHLREEAKRARDRLQFYMDNPEYQGPLRREADLQLMKERYVQMVADNHYCAKQSEAPRWTEAELSAAETAISGLQESNIQVTNGSKGDIK